MAMKNSIAKIAIIPVKKKVPLLHLSLNFCLKIFCPVTARAAMPSNKYVKVIHPFRKLYHIVSDKCGWRKY